MKTTLKILPLLFGVMLFFTQCEKDVELEQTMDAEAFMNLKAEPADPYENYTEQGLWAGAGQNDTDKGYLVGKVIAEITMDNNVLTLSVEYIIDEPWEAIETHLWVGADIQDIPQNAAPGQFTYSGGLLFENIDLSALGIEPGESVFIAAHAVVAIEGYEKLEDFEKDLPETATFQVKFNSPESYFLATVTDAGILDGDYLSYCINPGVGIDLESPYSATVFSSYDVPDYIVPFEENFPQVNWIINNVFVEEGTTMADIQEAIWVLLFGPRDGDPGFPTSGPNTLGANQTRVDDILSAAESYENFMPECGDDLVIVLFINADVQPIIIWKPFVCGYEETAWAFGQHEFMKTLREGSRPRPIANKWGWIFEMTYHEDEN